MPETETFGKMRDGVDPHTGRPRLWCFNEGPDGGDSWLKFREVGSAVWGNERIPYEGNAVGGRGLAVDPSRRIVGCGGSDKWRDDKIGRAYVKTPQGTWSLLEEHRRTLLWEAEFAGPGGSVYAFWNRFGGVANQRTTCDGVEIENPPGADISQAAWFPRTGHMYCAGNLSNHDPRVWRYEGGRWRTVLDASGLVRTIDHLVYVPRGPGELWATGMSPFGAGWYDGAGWHVAAGVPAVDTGHDTNHLTALGYYGGRVWLAARDRHANHIRLFRENIPSTIA